MEAVILIETVGDLVWKHKDGKLVRSRDVSPSQGLLQSAIFAD